jgi:SSS family transporter
MNERAPQEVSTTNNVSDYLTANSSMGFLPVAFSLLASFFSATALAGTPAEIYQYGIQNWIGTFGMMVTPLIGAFVTGPFFANLNIVTVFDYLQLRFDSIIVKKIGAFCYVLRNFISSAIFMYGAATSLSVLTGLNEKIAITLMGFVATFYTTIGGIRAVIWTDLFQMLVMFFSLFAIFIKSIINLQGFENLWNINKRGGRLNFFDFNPDPFVRQSFWSLFFGMIVYFSISYCFDQQMIQRFQAVKTKKLAQKALLLNIPGIFLIMSLCCFNGLILYATYYSCDPLTARKDVIKSSNQLIGFYVLNDLQFFPGFAGLFLGSIFCGALSSVSSYLNSQASIIWNDFFKVYSFFNSLNDSKSLLANQLIVFICGIIGTSFSLIISTLGGNLVQINLSLNGSFNAPLIGLFTLGLFFPLANKNGAIFGTIAGLLASLWISFGAFIVQPYYPKLDVSIDGCQNSSLLNVTYSQRASPENAHGFIKFYSLSYMWYTTFGTLVTVVFGLIFSILTKKWDKHNNQAFVLLDFFGFIKFFKSFSNKL